MHTHSRVSRYTAEAVGTFFLVYTVCCNVRVIPAGGALCVGAILMAMIYALGPVSGAHLNPAVSLGIYFSGRKKISGADTLMYMLCQFLGASLAGLSYSLFFRQASVLAPVGSYTLGKVFFVETVFTMALVYIVLNVATTTSSANNHYFGLSIGFCVTASAVAIGGISNCCLNPAVALGSLFAALITHGSSSLADYPIYFVAPFLGAILGVLAFYLVRRKEEYEPMDIGLFKLEETVPGLSSGTVTSGEDTPDLSKNN